MIDLIYWQNVRSDVFKNVDYNEFLIITGNKSGTLSKSTIDFLERIVQNFNSSENEYKEILNTEIFHYDDIIQHVQNSFTYREFDNIIFNICRKMLKKFCPRKERKQFLNKIMSNSYE